MSVEHSPKDDLADFFAKGAEQQNSFDLLRDYQHFSAAKPERLVRSVDKDSRRLLFRANVLNGLVFTLGSMTPSELSQLNDEQRSKVDAFIGRYLGNQREKGDEDQVWTSPEEVAEALDVLEALGVDMTPQRAEFQESVQRWRDREAVSANTLLGEFKNYTISSEHANGTGERRSFDQPEAFTRLRMGVENLLIQGTQYMTEGQMDAAAFFLGWVRHTRFDRPPHTDPEAISVALHTLEVLGLNMKKQREELRELTKNRTQRAQ